MQKMTMRKSWVASQHMKKWYLSIHSYGFYIAYAYR